MVARSPTSTKSRLQAVWLENGYRLTTAEFMRRWEALPQIKHAELIDGIVFLPAPRPADSHCEPVGALDGWLGYFASQTSGAKFYANPTLILVRENTPQPDSVLCYTPAKGGKARINKNGYLTGAPELVCEVSSSSASLDMNAKLAAYRRSGVQEYLVWLTGERRICWFVLEEDEYLQLTERSGLLKSRVFPGLTLDVKALLAMKGARVLAVQQRHLRK